MEATDQGASKSVFYEELVTFIIYHTQGKVCDKGLYFEVLVNWRVVRARGIDYFFAKNFGVVLAWFWRI